MKGLNPRKVDPRLQGIVGSIHVGTPYKEVLRETLKQLGARNRKHFRADRPAMRALTGMVIHQHNLNRAEYLWVMGGCR